MEITIKTEQTVDVKSLQVDAHVRYWENSTINGVDDEDGSLIPCKSGEAWRPLIEIETGKILNWEQGKKAEIHFKVCDRCCWYLLDANNRVVLKENEGDYVPETLSPKGRGYGDYIIMDIDENGMIDNWLFDIDDFKQDDE
jgi:hypothetical protein